MWILILFIWSTEGIQLKTTEFKTQTTCMGAMYDFKQAMKPSSAIKIKSVCVKK